MSLKTGLQKGIGMTESQQVPEFWELGEDPLTEIDGVQWRAAL